VKNKRFGHKRKPKTPTIKKRPPRILRINGDGDSNGEDGVKSGRGGDTGRLLTDPKKVTQDLRLLNRAVRSGWNIKRKNMIKRRLEGILGKTVVSVPTKNGMVEVDGPADSNAIAAARVLVAMNGQDQADDFAAMKKPETLTPPNINVNIDARQSPIIQLAKSLGASSLIIDGAEVSIAEGAGESEKVGVVQPAAGEQVVRDTALAKARAILEPEE
jgi:hypothetical protein